MQQLTILHRFSSSPNKSIIIFLWTKRTSYNNKKNTIIFIIYLWYFIFIIIVIISKTCKTGPSRKNKVVYKLLSQPHKQPRHAKLKKTRLREATNGWLHSRSHPAFRCQTQCREGSNIRTWAGRKHLANLDVLHLETSNSNGWAAASARYFEL